jgi:hypothetical protein
MGAMKAPVGAVVAVVAMALVVLACVTYQERSRRYELLSARRVPDPAEWLMDKGLRAGVKAVHDVQHYMTHPPKVFVRRGPRKTALFDTTATDKVGTTMVFDTSASDDEGEMPKQQGGVVVDRLVRMLKLRTNFCVCALTFLRCVHTSCVRRL